MARIWTIRHFPESWMWCLKIACARGLKTHWRYGTLLLILTFVTLWRLLILSTAHPVYVNTWCNMDKCFDATRCRSAPFYKHFVYPIKDRLPMSDRYRNALEILGWNNRHLLLQSRPLVWSTDIRSTRLYGQFFAGPERIWHFVSERARLKVKNARLYGQNLGQKLIFFKYFV